MRRTLRASDDFMETIPPTPMGSPPAPAPAPAPASPAPLANREANPYGGGSSSEVTRLLQAASVGDRAAAADLLPILYEELRRLAQARLAWTPQIGGNQTLQATALVHEAYLRLVGDEDPGWGGRGHFFGAAARAMRDILVEQARRKGRLKRGGDRRRVDIEAAEVQAQAQDEELIALDEALKRLEADDPRKGQVVNLRYFAGLTSEQTAAALGISLGTVERDWRYIKAWLHTQLVGGMGDAGGTAT